MTCKECKFYDGYRCVADVPVWASYLMYKSPYDCAEERVLVCEQQFSAEECDVFERRVRG